MYDLHAHILPGVDDGAKTHEDTIEMARVAAEQGTKVILTTPHRKDITENWSVQHIQGLLSEINGKLKSEGIDLTMLQGMENHLDFDLPDEIANGRALPMNGTQYILVEMPFFGRPNYIEDVLFRIQVQGLIPVLAHPERIEAFQRDPALLASFVERGMLSQITAGSVLGYFGGKAQKFTNELLRRRLAHIIASDTHFPGGPRSPKLVPGMEAAAKIVGLERARAMVVDTPKAILDGLPLELEPPLEASQTKRRWQFWR